MSYRKAIQIDFDANDALDLVRSELGDEAILGEMHLKTVVEYIGIQEFLGYYGTGEILAHISDAEIEEEFLNRSPLGKALT